MATTMITENEIKTEIKLAKRDIKNMGKGHVYLGWSIYVVDAMTYRLIIYYRAPDLTQQSMSIAL
jgi:hypothetical protein